MDVKVRVGGVGAELELDDGIYIYEIEVVTRTRRVMELEYDATTGELLDVEEDD